MVTRCIEALDRLEEVSQQAFKKSSVQEKKKNIELRLNHPKWKKSKRASNKRMMKIDSQNTNRICDNVKNKEVGEGREQDRLVNKTLKKRQSDRKFKLKLSTSRSESNTKSPQGTVESCEVLKNLPAKKFEEKLPEPLCWEEQLNSELVTLVDQKQRPLTDNSDKKECDSHPVVFHDKKWVEEMLLKKQCQYQITSFCLPTFQVENKPVKNRSTVRKLANEKQKTKSSQKLVLTGKPVSDVCKTSTTHVTYMLGEDRNTNLQCQSNVRASSATLLGNSFLRESVEVNQGDDQRVSQTLDTTRYYTSIRSSDSTDQFIADSKQYVDISVPNADYTETIPDDCQSMLSYATLQSDLHDVSFSEETLCKHQTSLDDNYSNKQDSSENIGEPEYYNKAKTDIRERNTCYLSKSAPELSKVQLWKCPKRCSSRLIYTPVSSPLYFSDQVTEFPRSVSPVKKLMELRQNFCENIRKEAKQLEFDLQELYLKKQLHKR